MRALIRFVLFAFSAAPVLATSPVKFSTAYQFIDGRGGKTGHEVAATGLYQYYKKNKLELSYQSLGKSYLGVPMRYDRLLELGHYLNLNDDFYFYSRADFNFSQHYSEDWGLYGEPHWMAWRELDVAIGAHFKSYPHNKAFALRPNFYLPLFERLILRGRSDIALKPDRAVSGEGSLEAILHPRFSIRAGGGWGKTDEGDGLLDDFHQWSVSSHFRATKHLRLLAEMQVYRGDLRKENRFGGGLDFAF